MAEIDKANAGGKSGKSLRLRFQEEAKIKEESKQPSSPAKSERSDGTREQPSPVKSECSDGTLYSVATDHVTAKAEEGLPLRIRQKDYSIFDTYEEADTELWKDLRTADEESGGSFLDKEFIKYIFINLRTGKAYVEMPTKYHEDIVNVIKAIINGQSTAADPVYATANGVIELTNHSGKHPDIFIFGKDRTKDFYGSRINKKIEIHKKKKQRTESTEIQVSMENMNPDAIIEISWTNLIGNELEKFALQMKKFEPNLGVIKVGYLIKFIPKTKSKMPTSEDLSHPLVGFDVYRMKTRDKKPALMCEWRYGQGDPHLKPHLTLEAEVLDRGPGADVSIPLMPIVDELVEWGVKFETPEGN